MKILDLVCTKCSEVYEEWIKSEEDINTMTCPKCNASLKKIISNPKHYKHVSWSQWRVDHK